MYVGSTVYMLQSVYIYQSQSGHIYLSIYFSQFSRQFCNFSLLFIYLFIYLFLFVTIKSGLLVGIGWSVCILKSHRSLCESFSRTGAGLCICHLFVWSNWNILHISQWITCWPSRVSPYTPSVLIYCIRLLWDWSFRFCHRIAYIYCFVESYLFSFWYDWFLWRCPVLLLL